MHPEFAAAVSSNPETVFMELTKILFNPWVVGVILAAILSAIMSTLSCQLLVCSSALTEDLYKGFIRKNASQKELVWVGRAMVIAVAMLALALAQNPESKVLGLVAYAWAGFGAAFGPLILLSLFWKRMTLNGALVGMVVGALTVILWKNFFGYTGIYEIIPGFVFALISIVVVSLLGKAPNAAVTSRFEQADEIYTREIK
jgi:sodium/proline symporter